MQNENFNPLDYESIVDISGNAKVTLMSHSQTNKLIVRKTINGANKRLYQQLLCIRHENLVRILGLEDAEIGCYSYEEYINGKTLADVLAEGPVPEKTAENWIGCLCSAIRTLHEHNPIIIHRDIKPSNVMLTDDGIIKVIDFDAAKEHKPNQRQDTELIGTPNYAAPEQYGFATSDSRTDIYAIGILFHELLTGSKPNESITPYRGRYKYIIQKCIELEPKRRYRSVRELEYQLGLRGIMRVIRTVPGFRTGVWWKKFVASVVCIATAIGAVSTVYEDPSLLLLGSYTSFFAPLYLLITNPLRFRENFPLIRSNSVPIKVAGIILYLLIWFLVFAIFAVSYSNRINLG
jgi:hypothetical protein